MDKGLDLWEAGFGWRCCFVHRKGHFQKIRTEETQVFWHQNLHTVTRLDAHDMVIYMGRTGQRTARHHCKSCNNIKADMENTRMWPQTLQGQLLFLPRPVRWHGHDTHLLLWHCQLRQEGHATWLRPQENETQTGRYSSKDGGELTAILWRGKCYIHRLTNIHDASAEGNSCNNNGKAIKPQIVVDYYRHMGCLDKGDTMSSLHSINHHTWKNSYILLSSCGGKRIWVGIK